MLARLAPTFVELDESLKLSTGRILLFMSFTCACVQSQAQCVLNISATDTVCQEDTIDLSFAGAGYTEAVWDLCAGDLDETPAATNLGNINNAFNYPNSINFVQDSGNWYGFVKNQNLSVFYRLNFGNSPRNTPTLDTISFSPASTVFNIGSWGKIELIKEGATWYGFTVMDNNRLVRINFGPTLTSNTVGYDIFPSPFGLLNNPRDVSLIQDTNGYHALIMNVGSGNVSVLNFGSSVSNAPLSGFNIVIGALATSPISIACANDCGNYVGFVGGLGNNNICRIDFGNAINNAPTLTQLGTNGDFQKPNFIRLTRENGKWYAFVKVLSTQGIYKLDFGSSLLNSPQSTVLGGFGNLINSTFSYGIDIASDSSQWTIMAMNAAAGQQRFVRLDYPDNCSFTQPLVAGQSISVPTTVSDSGSVHFSVTATGSDTYLYQSAGTSVVLPKPAASFDFGDICQGDSTYFTDLSTPPQDIDAWNWNFGGAGTSASQYPLFQFPDTGNYPVTLNVTNVFGCADTYTGDVIIKPLPTAAFDPDTACAMAQVVLNEASFVDGDSLAAWTWIYEGDTAFSADPAITFDSTGSFDVVLITTTSSGCTDTVTHAVVVTETPEIAFTVDGTCFGDLTTFTNATTFGSGTVQYDWDFGDGSTSTLASPTHVYADTGSYTLWLTALGSNGCADSLSLNLGVGLAPNANFGLGTTLLCSGDPIQFLDSSTVTDGTITGWVWDFDDGSTSTAQHPVHVYDSAGAYAVSLQVFSGTACDTSVTKTITVLGSPVVAFDFLGNCLGDTVRFTDLSAVPETDSIASWSWNFGNGNTSTEQDPVWYFSDQASYPVQLTVTAFSGCASTTMEMLTIIDPLTASLEHGTDTLCTFLSVPFRSTSGTAPEDSINVYEWTVFWEGDPILSDTLAASAFTPALPGVYTIELAVTSAFGCRSAASKSFEVYESPELEMSAEGFCHGDATQFTDNYSGTNYGWNWSFGDDATSSLDDPAHVYADPGSYLSGLLLIDKASGCFDTISQWITVLELPTIAYNTAPLCTGLPVQFTDSSFSPGDSIVRWEWQLLNVDTSFMQHPEFIFSDSNQYALRISVKSAMGCHSEKVDFLKPMQAPAPAFDFNPRFGTPPMEVVFTNTGPVNLDYLWIFGDGDTASGRHQEHTFTHAGEFNVMLQATAPNGCSGSTWGKVMIDSAAADIAVEELLVTKANGFLEFEVITRNMGTVTIEGYEVLVEVPGAGTVREHVDALLFFGETHTARLSARLRYDGGGYELACTELGIGSNYTETNIENNRLCISDLQDFNVFDVFPNPASEQLNVYLLTGEEAVLEIQIEDIRGRIQRVETFTATRGVNLLSWDISGLLPGVHVVRISHEDHTFARRFIKF